MCAHWFGENRGYFTEVFEASALTDDTMLSFEGSLIGREQSRDHEQVSVLA